MGNGYKEYLSQQNPHQQRKGTFLPMMCSASSIKDATLPTWENRCTSFSNDPLSPKIGCMGQVKRSNRIVGFPSSSTQQLNTTTPKDTTISINYSKLKKMFSGRNLTTTASTTPASIPNIIHYRRRQLKTFNSDARGSKTFNGRENRVGSISIEDMDPPLPVIKKASKPVDGGEANSLWKRRCVGVSLTNLQLQQIQLNRHSLAPTSV